MSKIVKAISLWEPWASAVMTGAKTVETRSWHTHYRGELLICAAKKKDKKSLELLNDVQWQKSLLALHAMSSYHNPFHHPTGVNHLNFGKAVAMVDVIDCIPSDYFKNLCAEMYYDNVHLGDFSDGRFVWVLDNIKRVKEPFEVKGSQGFFNVQLPDGDGFEEVEK